MSADIDSIRDNRVVDEIHAAVVSAINTGWTPERFIRSAREAWHDALNDKLRGDMRAFQAAT